MGRPTSCHVPCRSIVESLFASEIVRDRHHVCLGRVGDVPGAGAIKAARREDPNGHLKQALPRGLAAVAGGPRSGGCHSVRFHEAPLPHARDYKTGIELYQSGDL